MLRSVLTAFVICVVVLGVTNLAQEPAAPQEPAAAPQRLKAIRLDMYRWESGRYADYDKFIESWRKEL